MKQVVVGLTSAAWLMTGVGCGVKGKDHQEKTSQASSAQTTPKPAEAKETRAGKQESEQTQTQTQSKIEQPKTQLELKQAEIATLEATIKELEGNGGASEEITQAEAAVEKAKVERMQIIVKCRPELHENIVLTEKLLNYLAEEPGGSARPEDAATILQAEIDARQVRIAAIDAELVEDATRVADTKDEIEGYQTEIAAVSATAVQCAHAALEQSGLKQRACLIQASEEYKSQQAQADVAGEAADEAKTKLAELNVGYTMLSEATSQAKKEIADREAAMASLKEKLAENPIEEASLQEQLQKAELERAFYTRALLPYAAALVTMATQVAAQESVLVRAEAELMAKQAAAEQALGVVDAEKSKILADTNAKLADAKTFLSRVKAAIERLKVEKQKTKDKISLCHELLAYVEALIANRE